MQNQRNLLGASSPFRFQHVIHMTAKPNQYAHSYTKDALKFGSETYFFELHDAEPILKTFSTVNPASRTVRASRY